MTHIIEIKRFSSAKDDTLGLVYVDGRFFCFSLEDEHRRVKVKHETRIPGGGVSVRLSGT